MKKGQREKYVELLLLRSKMKEQVVVSLKSVLCSVKYGEVPKIFLESVIVISAQQFYDDYDCLN